MVDTADAPTALPAQTLPGLLAHRVRTAPDEVVMVCDEQAMTYAELDRDSRAIGARLSAAGLGKGDRIALLMPNGIDWLVAAVAVWRIGAVLVPLSTLLRPPELLATLRVASVTALILTREYRNRRYLDELEEVLPGASGLTSDAGGVFTGLPPLRRVWVWSEHLATPDPGPPAWPEPDVRPADDLVVLFTSGSRGTPKGCIHTHGGALRAVAAGLPARCVRPGDRLYIPMPFFWAGGLAGGLLTALVAGATLLTEVTPEPAKTIEFLKRERVTLFRGWPQQGRRIAEQPGFDPADLPYLRAGSLDAVLPPPLRSRPGARANLFGMSETFGPYAGYPLDTDLPPDKFGSCGQPFPDIEVRIVDPTTRAPVPAGHRGEILLRGRTLMRGICGRENHEVFDRDGFYPTGDVGRLDADGFLWYEGRLDDMFKVSGATVYPSEVESALRSLDGVRQAVVTNVPAGDRQGGGGGVVGPDLDIAQLTAALRRVLSSFKVPTVWLLLTSEAQLPRLASDKIDLPEVRRRLGHEGSRLDSLTSN